MAVALARSGQNAVFTVTVGVADLIAAVQTGTMTAAQAKVQAAGRAALHLSESADAAGRTDVELDERAAATQAEMARLKTLRPTGGF